MGRAIDVGATMADHARGRLREVEARRRALLAELATLDREAEAHRRLAMTFEAVAVAGGRGPKGGSLRREVALVLAGEARQVGEIPGLLAERFGRSVAKKDVWPVLSRMKAEGALRSVRRGVWALRRARRLHPDEFGHDGPGRGDADAGDPRLDPTRAGGRVATRREDLFDLAG